MLRFKKPDSPPMEPPSTKHYPTDPDSYQLYEEIGQGSSASVYRALCTPFHEIVAIKILDFEHGDPNNITQESKTMTLVNHPNVLKAYCSFVRDQNVWVVMPYMDGGSCLHILKAAFPEGFCEAVIATILHGVLKGLVYLHEHGLIHRDVKAGNILVNGHGAIKLGDLGVSAWLYDSGDRQRTRNTFVGTPCWMAPEVMAQLYGYDFKADIWSFGITALELAHGHAPFSKFPPHKVLLMTLQNAPPGLDYERDKKFSKSFRQMIAMCLVKEPSKRPSAQKLLKHPFFKNAKTSECIVRKLLDGLPTLGKRMESLKMKEADLLAQKKISDGKREEISQIEYKRGISDWNFNVNDIKAEASLIHDAEEIIPEKDQGSSSISLFEHDREKESSQCQSSSACHCLMNYDTDKENDDSLQNKAASLPLHGLAVKNLKDRCTEYDDNMNILSNALQQQNVTSAENSQTGKYELVAANSEDVSIHSLPTTGASLCNSLHDIAHSQVEETSGKKQFQVLDSVNHNGALVQQAVVTNDDEHPRKPEGQVVQQRGRFKVTSEDVDIAKVHLPPLQRKSSDVQVSRLDVNL